MPTCDRNSGRVAENVAGGTEGVPPDRSNSLSVMLKCSIPAPVPK